MGNAATFVRKLQTGSLPASIASTARPFVKRTDCAKWTVSSTENRFCFVGFKLTAKQTAKLPDGATIPSSFVVEVPKIHYTSLGSPDAGKFLDALIADYQDSVIADSANRRTTVSPVDWPRMIADYFETGRGGTTQKMLRDWIDEVFDDAFVKRQFQLNESAASESRAVKTPLQIEQLGRGLHEHLVTLTKTKDIFLPHAYLKMVRSHLVRLQEVELLAADDENVDYFVEKIDVLLQSNEQLMEDAA